MGRNMACDHDILWRESQAVNFMAILRKRLAVTFMAICRIAKKADDRTQPVLVWPIKLAYLSIFVDGCATPFRVSALSQVSSQFPFEEDCLILGAFRHLNPIAKVTLS